MDRSDLGQKMPVRSKKEHLKFFCAQMNGEVCHRAVAHRLIKVPQTYVEDITPDLKILYYIII